MNCMKCGREIPLGQVFCKECLADMEAYPVKPDTPIQLPVQSAEAAPKRAQPQKKSRKKADPMGILRAIILCLCVTLVAVTLFLGITVSKLQAQLEQQAVPTLPGQNYSTEEAT